MRQNYKINNQPGIFIVRELGPERDTIVQFRGDPGQNLFKIKFFHFLAVVVMDSAQY